ncbi:MetQ/NlpA family ABC transporter substrate-binding protein [Alicyclobacillus shizuokensis]|uniref:MetQ/NlpA family ABC transporter substrate-binding protein n=1 Tax=Alicyclobacillus shizuokensis TaxID=392014 RepID=UPI00082CDEB1|nr:MetQ/NlpA family ABC transporter substrate-binding protein [Alicyclobacillus shizuokensis]MCL6625632.1 MetQ/NlpA family ABC transporter substrate-binding protein [Alicyclobacillus shizuokensis]
MNTRNILRFAAVLGIGAALTAGCGASSQSTNPSTAKSSQQDTVLKVGATPVPHAEILDYVKPILAKKGVNLQVVEFNDYVQPNRALASGQLDANYFQHVPYLEEYNQKNHTDLVPTIMVHFEPLGLYPGKSKSLQNIPDGATVAVPNDTTNEGRALLLLANNGLIKLKDPNSLSETPNDIVSNPHHLRIEELDAAAIPRMAKDVNYAVINGNYALQAGYKVSDALAVEKANSQAARTYANVVVVRDGEQNKPAIKKLDKALNSEAVKKFIENHYHGSVAPVFGKPIPLK